MEKQFWGSLLLLLLQLTLASETSGQNDQQMGQSTRSRTSHNSALQTSSPGANITLATASTVITTIGRTTWVMADTQEGRITTTSPSIAVTTTGQDLTPSMNSTFKNQIVTTHSTSPQPMEAANTTGRGITGEDIMSETKATLITTAGENTNSLTTKMASDRVNGMIKATLTASTIATTEKILIQPTSTTSSLFKNPGGAFPIVSIASTTAASTAEATRSMMVPMSKTPGGTSVGIPSHSVWKTTTNTGAILNMMTMSEIKATTTVPATADSRKEMISSVATISSKSKSQGGSTTQAITSSTASPKTTTLPTALSTGSSGTNSSPFMSMARSSLPAMSSPCASDEYPRTTGEGGCMCNSNHYNHPDLNNVPVALSCQPWEMEVSLSQCFLETHGWIQGNDLFPGCTGISKIIHGWRAITFVLKRNESKCGLKLSTNTSHALYSLNAQLPPGLKTSNDSININFSCAYPLVVNVSQKVFSKEATSLLTNIHTTGTGDSNITMSIFSDAQFSILLGNQSATFQRPLFVALEAINADPNQFVLVVNAFFASTNDSGVSAPQTTYYFVKHGCPVSSRLLPESSPNGISLKVKLAFYPFRFFTSDVLYYHSQVMLCDKKNSSCQPTCTRMNPKWKIELDHQNKNKSGWLMYGPVQFQGSDPSHNRAPSGPMSVTFLLLVVINWILA